MILSAVLCAFIRCAFGSDFSLGTSLDSLFKSAGTSTEIVIGLSGMMCFWLGLSRIMERSGFTSILANFLSPLFRVIMPSVPKGHPALGSISMNLSANMLGLDNAATPLGIQAMKDLESINPNKGTASDSQIMFLVLNTSSVTIFPIAVFLYRSKYGAASPTEVFLPILLSTLCSTIAGFSFVAVAQKLKIFQAPLILAGSILLGLIAAIGLWASYAGADLVSQSTGLSNGAVLLVIGLIIAFGLCKKRPIFEDFTDGAKEGFKICIDILPYLVAMLGAVALMRASGLLDLLLDAIRWLMALFTEKTEFVDALPVSMMHPFSGGGARAMMLDVFETFGVDSFQGKIASVMQGSTETTFYVLAVYFGSVGIKKFRYAVWAGLFADFASMIASILIGYMFFG